jgi:hypothetical protein
MNINDYLMDSITKYYAEDGKGPLKLPKLDRTQSTRNLIMCHFVRRYLAHTQQH